LFNATPEASFVFCYTAVSFITQGIYVRRSYQTPKRERGTRFALKIKLNELE
jgi:hypothetical protein